MNFGGQSIETAPYLPSNSHSVGSTQLLTAGEPSRGPYQAQYGAGYQICGLNLLYVGPANGLPLPGALGQPAARSGYGEGMAYG